MPRLGCHTSEEKHTQKCAGNLKERKKERQKKKDILNYIIFSDIFSNGAQWLN